jgi:membrane-bound lytic murein transglycosylase D
MMRYKTLSLIILGWLVLGCSGTRRFFWLSESPESAKAVEEETYSLLDPEIPLYLTPEERFEDVQRCYSDALDSAAAGNDAAAQDLFEYAIVNLSDLDADSLDLDPEDLDWLSGQLVADYAKFLDQLPLLPEESSPSAVYLALAEFLGDSVESWEDLIDIVLSPDSYDTSAVAAYRLYPPVPLEYNAYVEDAVRFFQTKGHKVFTKWLERSEDWIPYLSDLLRQEGMPQELVYLSMIESGFSTSAYSRAHASGLWQFISSTAKIYGLQVNKYYDQRRDPEASTRAACRYLRKLYNQFGDWYLAFASYNCGERRVEKVSERTGKNNYWQIRSSLPRQTRDYVPYYLAARLICQDPEKYGFQRPTHRRQAETNVVYVDGSIDLRTIAQCANIDYETVKALNPALKKGCTPPNAKNFPVRLPKNSVMAENFSEQISKAPRLPVKTEVEERSDWVRHRVRSGETLATIAAKYGVSVKAIMNVSANKLKSPHRIRAGRYLLIPVREEYVATAAEPAVGQPQPAQVTSSDGSDRIIYRVRRGDTVGKIALKYRVQPSDIKTWNNLWGEKYIYPGQSLIVWTRAGEKNRSSDFGIAENPAPSSLSAGADLPSTYTIRRGDTLWDLAKRFGLSVQQLKQWNGIRSAHRLQPGEQIRLEP